MHLFLRLLPVAAVVVSSETFAAPCTPAWVTVDDYAPPGAVSSSPTAVLVHGDDVFVGGMVSDPLTGRWIMRKKVGAGAFTTVDDFIYTIGFKNRPLTLFANGQTVMAVGGANNLSEWGRWLVRRSTNGGSTWALADDFDGASVSSWGTSMTSLKNGALLSGGFRYNAADSWYHWITRTSFDLGATWTTANDYGPMHGATGPYSMATDKAGDVYATGINFNYVQYQWQTRKLSAATGVWTTADDWKSAPDTAGQSVGAAGAGVATGKQAGMVLVAGSARLADGRSHWIVRRSTDGGASWTIVDDVVDCLARAITFDKKDEKGFLVTGRCDVNGQYRWVTRMSDQNGLNWVTEDDYALSSAGHSIPNAIDYARGGTYAVGVADSGTEKHWIVRARVCAGDTITPLKASPQTRKAR